MSSFLVSLQDQGKTNIALKFNKEDGVLKYYNDFGDFSCFVQAHALVYLDVCLITNKGTMINHETHIGKGKKKEGSVFQTNPLSLQTDTMGRCSFRCHVYTSCQNCKCLFFMLKVTWKNEAGDSFCLLSSPFVGATKDPNQTQVTSMSCSFLSSISHEDFLRNGQLTTMIVYKNNEEMASRPKSEKHALRDAKYSHKQSLLSEVVDTSQITLVVHQVTATEEVLSYFKEISSFDHVSLSIDSELPSATYKLSKARSLSHQSADSIEINKDISDSRRATALAGIDQAIREMETKKD